MTDDPGRLRERIAVLETSHEHMGDKIDRMAEQLAEVHDVLLAAKGARWTIAIAAMVVGFIVGNFPWLAKLVGFLK